MYHVPLFESQHLRLTSIDLDKDAQVIASWTDALDMAAKLREDHPARPMATFEVRKMYERIQKESDEYRRQFLFAIRLHDNPSAEQNPVIGVMRIKHIEYVHGASFLDLILADPQNWQIYAREALEMALCYAFEELNLFRVTAVVASHNHLARQLFEQANFTLEVRQRETVYWENKFWDKLYYGILRPEWKMQQVEVLA